MFFFLLDTHYNSSSSCSGPALEEYQVISFRCCNIDVFVTLGQGGNENDCFLYILIRSLAYPLCFFPLNT